MFTLMVATTNNHKINEIRPLFENRSITLKSLADIQDFPEIIEDGSSFEENAAIKARTVFNKFRLPVIADDSGLVVPALNNAPGIYSARYAGPEADYYQNNLMLLKNMQSLKKQDRLARFVCTICYKDNENELFFTGITEGQIIDSFKGEDGFGYDPLFFYPKLNKTFAQLSMQEKNKHSHRGKAVRKFIEYFDKNI
jgi:XTP/dITP diphosphohydrolase